MSPSLDPAGLDLLFREARTPHAFTDEPVTDDQIRAVYDLVKFAPTSLNQQPLRMVLVRSPEARARLARYMYDENRDQLLGAPLNALLLADNEFHEQLPRLFPVFPQAKDLYYAERPAREESAAFNAALQMGYLILAIRAVGLAAGPMTGFDFPGVAKEFAGPDHSVVAVMNIGRPARNASSPRLPRLDYDEVVTTV
ncbi:malonic semialdehyde reductase [Streptomyces coeruleorubidus]|uniref:malonic semialdehyde reductase n=1 Tax=Streptomyces coeruleorubidus TaxID=116188 RepID=UPI0033E8CEE3